MPVSQDEIQRFYRKLLNHDGAFEGRKERIKFKVLYT